MTADRAEVFACPRCAGGGWKLNATDGGFACPACGQRYPILGGIPCLMPDPAQFQIGWQGRLLEYRIAIEARLREINVERERDNLPRRTRERLLRVIVALQTQRRAVESLMAAIVGGDVQSRPGTTARPGGPAASLASLAVMQHYENIFRDWAWGADENDRQLTKLLEVFGTRHRVQSMAVYGAGTGRLASDLHGAIAPERTYAFDTNPLPLIVGDQLVRGGTLELPEFPVAPRGEQHVAVTHRLRATSQQARAGLTFLFADAFFPPFAPASLDLVITPWFIDIAGVELSVTASAINSVLRPGGTWLNLGPLLFKGAIAGQHAIEEVGDIVRDTGFEVLIEGHDDVPYFRSPYSGSTRIETIYWHAATKVADAAPVERTTTEPAWLVDPRLPVPMLPQFTEIHRSSIFTVGVLSMIDGRRSIVDMTMALSQSWQTEPVTVANHLRAFFAGMFN